MRLIDADRFKKYIPTIFLNAPELVIPDRNGGARIEYSNSKRQWDKEKEQN